MYQDYETDEERHEALDDLLIWPNDREPDSEVLDDGNIAIFAGKETNDKVRDRNPNLKGRWIPPKECELGDDGEYGYWKYPKSQAYVALVAYSLNPIDYGIIKPKERDYVAESEWYKPMSRIRWAKNQKQVKGNARYLLRELAECFNVRKGYTHYGVKALAENMGVHERTVYEATRKLESAGLITVDRHPHRANRYRLSFA